MTEGRPRLGAGEPTIDELIEGSSLATPGAKMLRARTSSEVLRRFRDRDGAAVIVDALSDQLGTILALEYLSGWIAARIETQALVAARVGPGSSDGLWAIDDTEAPTFDGYLDDEIRAAVRDGFGELPKLCRDMLRLLVTEPPLSYQEISDILHLPLGSVGPIRRYCLRRFWNTASIRSLLEGRSGSDAISEAIGRRRDPAESPPITDDAQPDDALPVDESGESTRHTETHREAIGRQPGRAVPVGLVSSERGPAGESAEQTTRPPAHGGENAVSTVVDERDRLLLRCLAHGEDTQHIAQVLASDEAAVEAAILRLSRQFGAQSRLHLVALAMRAGTVTLSEDTTLTTATEARYRLSVRELEVWHLLGEGLSTKQIGEHLHINTGMVSVLLLNIERKLRRGEATTAMGCQQGLGALPPQ